MCCVPEALLSNVSIIIPIAGGETAHENLLKDLESFTKGGGAEIIVSSEGSRAKSLNAGAAKASREFLWFLHADSRVTQENIDILKRCLKREPEALHYFLLRLGYGRPALNAWGANIRSVVFGLPYGDQGFVISKAQFEKIGGYPEYAYGEDLLFVRKAKKIGVRVAFMPSKLSSSARKYRDQGWLKTTLKHQWMLLKLLRHKL